MKRGESIAVDAVLAKGLNRSDDQRPRSKAERKTATSRESGSNPERSTDLMKKKKPSKAVSEYMAEIGRKGGSKSKRKLTRAQALAMVAARRGKGGK
jgi:hypothetical protein